MMRGLDPRAVHAVPLSKQDTAGNSFLKLCNLLSWSTVMTALLAIVLDAVLLVAELLPSSEITLHLFGIVMATAIIFAEREFATVLRLCAFLESWLLKGLFISFVGTLLLAFNHRNNTLDVWRNVVGFTLIFAGILYFALGALCVRQLRMYQLRAIRRKKAMKQELQSLSSQKAEIEKLLADTESKLELL